MKTLTGFLFVIAGFTVQAQPKMEKEVSQEVILRASPPDVNLFYNKGEQIGVLTKNSKVQILDSAKINYLNKEERWYKVREVKDNPTGNKEKDVKVGWIYAGKPDQQN